MSSSRRKEDLEVSTSAQLPSTTEKSDSSKVSSGCTTAGSMILPAPFDDDEAANVEREAVNYDQKIKAEMAMDGRAPRKIRVYADGIYDLFHQGHARQLMQAKNAFPDCQVYLLVGVCNDALTRARKGKTVMDEKERYEALRHCRYVDEVVKNAPWTVDDDFLNKHKIDFVAHDDVPYTIGSGVDVYADLKKKGMFVATQRTDGVSTSDVVARIVRDYDTYVRRNFARGYTRKDLNVSFLRSQGIKLSTKVHQVKETIEKKRDEYRQRWEDASKEVICAFLKLFGGRDWSMEQIWNSGKRRLAKALSPPNSPTPSEASSDNDDDNDNDDVEEASSDGNSKWSSMSLGNGNRKRKSSSTRLSGGAPPSRRSKRSRTSC